MKICPHYSMHQIFRHTNTFPDVVLHKNINSPRIIHKAYVLELVLRGLYFPEAQTEEV